MSITNNYTFTGHVPTATSSVTTTLNASGGSGASSASCASSASSTLASYTVDELVTNFKCGQLTVSDLKTGLSLKNIYSTITVSGMRSTLKFTHSGKNYTIQYDN